MYMNIIISWMNNQQYINIWGFVLDCCCLELCRTPEKYRVGSKFYFCFYRYKLPPSWDFPSSRFYLEELRFSFISLATFTMSVVVWLSYQLTTTEFLDKQCKITDMSNSPIDWVHYTCCLYLAWTMDLAFSSML